MTRNLQNLIKKTIVGLVVLAAGIFTPVLATVNVDVNLTINPVINTPPEAVTDLTALKADSSKVGEGKINLLWTVPPTSLDDVIIKGYQIRWSTNSVSDLLGDTTAWWNQAGGVNDYTYMDESGSTSAYTAEGLVPGDTYYFGIKAVDEFDNLGPIDLKTQAGNQANAVASYDITPPADITDLSGVPGSSFEEIVLNWTAPGDDGTVGDISGGKYRVDYATYTKVWDKDIYKQEFDADIEQGENDSVTISDLASNTTYYIVIWTSDENANWSAVSNVAQVKTNSINKAITTLTAMTDNSVDGKVDLEWTSIGGANYVMKYHNKSLSKFNGDTTSWWENATEYSQSWDVSDPGEKEQVYGQAGLYPGTTYYFSVRVADQFGSTSPIGNITWAVAGDTVPAAPANVNLEDVGGKVKVTWDKNSEPDISRYWIYRDDVIISSVPYNKSEFYDEDVEIDVAYTYKLKAEDNAGHISEFSEEKQIIVGISIIYNDVSIIKAENIKSNSITFSWKQVEGDVKGYFIERAENIAGPWTEVSYIYSTQTLRYTVPRNNDKVYYYRIRTLSITNSKSKGTRIIDTSEDTNHIYASDDFDMWVKVPESFIHELYEENNGGEVVKIILEKKENSDFLLSYNIKAVKGNKEVKDFIFNNTRKGARIEVPVQEDETSGVYKALQNNDSADLAVYWHNGVEWVKLGGIQEDGAICTSSRRLGKFGVKLAPVASEFTLNWVKPKIFTPEQGDYRINEVRFGFENPNDSEVTIRIFDVTGAEVRDNLRREGENVMVWDGRDKQGDIVRGGIYIYQIDADGKVINGTIVVAK